jgi:hypothetical protein
MIDVDFVLGIAPMVLNAITSDDDWLMTLPRVAKRLARGSSFLTRG